MATKTQKSKPLTDKQTELIERGLAILEEHGNPAQNTGELEKAFKGAGIKVTRPSGTNAVTGAGIRATATSGVHDAMRLWGQKARRALLRGEL